MGWAVDMPSWWQELGRIPEVGDLHELAQKIWASFKHPQWISKIHYMENYYLAHPSPKCLHQKDFLLPPDPMFPCWDIREEKLKKTVAYTQALQCWAEKFNQPLPGQPWLLVRCVLKLQEMMGQYVSFSDDTVLDGVAPPEGFFEDRVEITIPGESPPTFTNVLIEGVAMEEAAPLGGLLKEPTAPQVLHEEWTKVGASPNPFSGFEESAAPLSAGYHCCTSLSSPRWVEAEMLQPEFWGKESLMPKGRRVLARQSGRARFHITSWVPRANAGSHSTPRLQGSDGLHAKGPITFNHFWGAPGAHATRNSSWTCDGYGVP